MNLKPQDIVVALKLFSYSDQRPAISVIAADLGLSPSEVHGALRRLRHARLIHGREMKDKPNVAALEEFLVHGAQYAFPAQRGSLTRGTPTAYAASPLNAEIAPGNEPPPVWPWPKGDTRGIAFEPLYRTVPFAASHDPGLYALLALVDAIREGRTRERQLAEKELIKRLRSRNEKS